MNGHHWRRRISVLTGAWLIWSPLALGFEANAGVAGNAVLTGLALMAASLPTQPVVAGRRHWLEATAGLWSLASALMFSGPASARASALLAGVVVLAVALWRVQARRAGGRLRWRSDNAYLDLSSLLDKKIR